MNSLVTNTQDFSKTELEENKIAISDGYAYTNSRTDDTGTVTNTGTIKDTGTIKRDNTTTKDLSTSNAGGSFGMEAGLNISPVEVKIQGEGHADLKQEDGTIKDEGTTTNDLEKQNNLTQTNNLISKTNSNTKSHDETTTNTISKV